MSSAAPGGTRALARRSLEPSSMFTAHRVRERGRPRPLGEFVRSIRDDVLVEWARALTRLGPVQELTPDERVDGLHELIELIARTVDGAAGRVRELRELPQRHALRRIAQGFELGDVVREFWVLRSVLARRWLELRGPRRDPAELVALDGAIEEIVAGALESFTEQRERTLRALDKLSEAALAAGDRPGADVDSVLETILRALVESTPVIDTVELFLREGDRLRARASIGVRADVERRFSIAVGEGVAGRAAAEKRPIELHSASTDPLVESAALRASGVQALYCVPMMRDGEVLGAAHMASRQALAFSPDEKLLFRTVVARATAIVAHAQLVDELRATRDALAIERNKVEQIIANVPHAIFWKDVDGRFLGGNAHLLRDLGIASIGELVGHTDRDFLPRRQADAYRDDDRRVLETGEPLLEFEELMDRPDGAHVLLTSKVPLRDERGGVTGVLGVYIDITDRKRIEEELRREGAFRERFIGVLGHDLRNPLGAITMAASSLLRRASPLPDDVVHLLKIVDGGARRMARMIAELLDFTRARSGGGMPIAPRASDLHAICRAVVDELALVAPGRIELETRGDGRAVCDPDRAMQVVSNLAGNALAYGLRDRPVRVTSRGDAEHVRISVRNEGPAIPSALLPHLFDPFRRAVDPGSRRGAGGLGLGLFIAREIVAAHGGSIDVRSAEGQGTTFTVTWPRAPTGAER